MSEERNELAGFTEGDVSKDISVEQPKGSNVSESESESAPALNNDTHDDIIDEGDLNMLKPRKRAIALEETTQSNAYQQKLQLEQQQQIHEDRQAADKAYYSNESMTESNKRRQELEAKMERALKKPKMRKRKDEHDLTNDEDELIQILKNEMDIAAKKDAEIISQKEENNNNNNNNSNQNIAINKIQLLPKVDEILSKANLAEVILDNNLLAEMRQWLEPLPDASLPSYEIQKVLFAALLKLPINTNHLRESGIGKILLFYQKSKRVEPKIKRVADKLISDWTRPIIGASDNYRDKQVHSVDFDSIKFSAQKKRESVSGVSDRKSKIEKVEKTIYEQQAAMRNRAAAPAPSVTDYKFAPKSKIDKTQSSLLNAGVGTSLNRDDQFKRINQKLSGRGKRTTKKDGVSIEGRNKGY